MLHAEGNVKYPHQRGCGWGNEALSLSLLDHVGSNPVLHTARKTSKCQHW